ncbi:Lsr2 family DNA-binding protein [Citricoccus zhacaiensis]|nr:hypothetical protein [Cellulosimicrobium funkei]
MPRHPAVEIRQWARDNGYDVWNRPRLHQDILWVIGH